jgi:hypothetical protein
MAYELFIDKTQFPVAPSKLSIKINNRNEPIDLIDEGEVNILMSAGLTDIDFEVLLPNANYPFAIYPNGFQEAKYYMDVLEDLKVSKKPFQFIFTRTLPNGKLLFDTNIKVSLEDYSVEEDADNGFDVIVSISLKQFREYGTKKAKIITDSKGKKKSTKKKKKRSTKSVPKASNYKVKRGDSMWAIARKYYGSGTKWRTIYNANKKMIDKRNKGTHLAYTTIYPGQILLLPKDGDK